MLRRKGSDCFRGLRVVLECRQAPQEAQLLGRECSPAPRHLDPGNLKLERRIRRIGGNEQEARIERGVEPACRPIGLSECEERGPRGSDISKIEEGLGLGKADGPHGRFGRDLGDGRARRRRGFRSSAGTACGPQNLERETERLGRGRIAARRANLIGKALERPPSGTGLCELQRPASSVACLRESP